jgi:hypothetical protein
VLLARTVYDSCDFGAMPILADALQDAGCDDATILDHCRGKHTRSRPRVLGRGSRLGKGMGRAHRVAVSHLAVDALTLVPIDGVVADECDGASGTKYRRRNRAGAHPRATPDHGAREKTRW